MPVLGQQLELERCPHCGVNRPNLKLRHNLQTTSHTGEGQRYWNIHACERCGGVVIAGARGASSGEILWIFPSASEVDTAIPTPASSYLAQALESLHVPAGAVMLAASAVDAMLKNKGYTDGSLYGRINQAVNDHLITPDMATWAHEVRLDANEQRHADVNATLPSPEDSQRVVDFALALGQFLFVLPARVQRGLQQGQQGN